ncbi:hypothetical protein HJC23_012127 [Cyclotella cryptica]|uniref:Uncharacterized protein n=1 Tax=Cyclotella cryptica TaxID=29204 RepID=A0ABD3PK28_9STRA|eukprot:CCRYP_014262-RA/>CCRYP_014262-RA protein AED:0.10 eAED:0.10 QI:0/-1/0/1/-1/1/1/0/1043
MSSPSRRSCRYRQPPTTGLVSHKPPSSKNNDAQSTGGTSRWSIRSTSTWATIRKHRFSGIKRGKQPSTSSFAAAVKHPGRNDHDISSVATMNALEPLLGATESRPVKKMMRSSPFTFKTGSSSTSRLSFKMGKGSAAGPLTNESSIQGRRRRWKPMSSKKIVRIPSKVVLCMTKQTFSYDSFSSSRGSPSPPTHHVESTVAANSAESNGGIFVESTFDFDENAPYIGGLSFPDHFRSLENSEDEVDPMSHVGIEETSTESNPPPQNPHPRLATEQYFIPSFNPNPTLDEANGSDDRDQEHVLSASAGIKFFESLQKASSSNSSVASVKSPRSCGSWVTSSNGAFKSPDRRGFESPSSKCTFKSPDRRTFQSPSSSGFKLPSCYGVNESTESSVFKLPSSCKINECKEDCDSESQSSIPSICDSSSKDHPNQVTFPQDSTSDKELSDAVIAWTLLGAVMGSPAPQSVLRAQKRRRCNQSSNLWLDHNATDELNDDVINIDDVDLGDVSPSCPPSGSEVQPMTSSHADNCVMTLEQRINLLAQLSRDETDENNELNDSSSIPDVDEGALIEPLLYSEDKAVFNSGLVDSVVVSSPAGESDNDSVLDFYYDDTLTENVSVPHDSEEVANATIAWGALAALLGSPAPSCVLPKKERSPAINLWVDCATADDDDEIISLPASEIDESSEGNILPALSRDEELMEELSLSELRIDTNDTCIDQKDEDNASSVLAWSALAALLGSPAPSCVLRKQSCPVKNLWADAAANEDDDVISLSNSEGSFVDDSDDVEAGYLRASNTIDCDSVEDLSLSALDVEACDSREHTELNLMLQDKEQVTNSALAWGALTALLGLPAPTCVLQKNRPAVKNYWTNDDGSLNDDLISLAPSESPNDCDSGNLAHDAGSSSKECACIDDLSLSALQVDSDDSCECVEEAPFIDTERDITNSTIAWGALTALLGLPAPSCVLQKSNRHVKNLWAGDDDDDGLVSLAHSQGSCVDDSNSVPSLVAESQVGSYPSSPSIHNASSCESVSQSKEHDVVIDSFIEWSR